MTLARSRLTAQGQISVPAGVRRKLGITPGSVIEWDQEGDTIVVRRAGSVTFEEIHRAAFGSEKPVPRTLDDIAQGLKTYIQKRHPRRK